MNKNSFITVEVTQFLKLIQKFLLTIETNGSTPYYSNRGSRLIDLQLFGAMVDAINSFTKDLGKNLKYAKFEDNTFLLLQKFSNDYYNYRLSSLSDGYHITEGVMKKVDYVANKYFKDFSFENNKNFTDEIVEKEIEKELDDYYLRNHVREHYDWLIKGLDEVIMEERNNIIIYSLNSSTNQILKCNINPDLMPYRSLKAINDKDIEGFVESIIKEFLSKWNIEKIPQGEKWLDSENPEGVDSIDYDNTGENTLATVVNTAINIPREPWNEVLLYLFGKSNFMRNAVMDLIDVQLPEKRNQSYFLT